MTESVTHRRFVRKANMTAMILSLALRRPMAAALAATLGLGLVPQLAAAEPSHGIAIIGDPALPANFDHLPYANPDAPKGGKITYGVVGTFDSLNSFIVQGGTTSARGLADPVFGNLVFESLLMRNADEPFTLYGLIAQTVETPPDRSWVEFTLNPNAKFSDGVPVTVDDVIFSMEILRDKGRPNYKATFSKVDSVEKVGERGIRFNIANAKDRELPLIIGLMPILPKHAINPDTFDKSTLTPIIGSGPYILSEVHAPDYTIYKKNPDYWGKDLPIKRGLDNYDEIRVDYYRDANVMFEAFKKGLYDVQPEGDPSAWNANYGFPAVTDGKVVKETFKTGSPKGMQGYTFNTRRPIFADVRVRKALSELLDFDWINKNLYYGAFVRASGYFNESELSSIGVPASDKEKALLAPFPGVVEDDVMNGTYKATNANVAAGDRAVLKQVVDELKAAGYELTGSTMTNKATGAPLTFEILVTKGSPEDEKVGLAYQRVLARVGITATIRTVDSSEFQKRRASFDYDMVRNTYPASLSPGNEQVNRWSSTVADSPGSFNYPGAKSPAIDALIAAMLSAKTREDFVAAVRAYDRVLISGFYTVPFYYLPDQWIARWTRIEHPDKAALTGYYLPSWWAKPGN
jgi:peptide/nickel transport system substrate-binding protein